MGSVETLVKAEDSVLRGNVWRLVQKPLPMLVLVVALICRIASNTAANAVAPVKLARPVKGGCVSVFVHHLSQTNVVRCVWT